MSGNYRRPGLWGRIRQAIFGGKTYQGDGREGAGGWDTLFGTCIVRPDDNVFDSYSISELYALQRTSSLIAACVMKVGAALRAGDLALYTETEDGSERVGVGRRPRSKSRSSARVRGKALPNIPDRMYRIAKLLQVPNESMSQGDFLEVLGRGLVLVGDVYVWIWRDAYGNPEQIWPIPKTWVRENRDSSGAIAGYSIWQGSGESPKSVPREDLIRIWTPDAENPLRAVSAVEAVARELRLDDERSSYLMELLRNVPFAGAVFKQKAEWDEEQKAEIRARVASSIGRGARGSIAFVSGEHAGVEFPNPLSDLDWPGLASYLESRVSAALDVPAIVAGFRVGLEHGTFANYEQATRMFYQGRIAPLGLKIAETLTRGLIYADDPMSAYWIDMDWSEVPAMQEQADAREKRILDRLRGMAITRNEARVALGEDAVEGGDVFLDSAGIVPTPADADPWLGDVGRDRKPMDWHENEIERGEIV